MNDLTSSNHDIVTSVYYIQALLVTEAVELLQQIVNTLVHITEKDLLSQYIAAAARFLKSRYQKHSYDDSAKSCAKKDITCPQCMFPYFVCDQIKECITTNTTTPVSESGSITDQILDGATSVIKQ